ncbi:MAG: hypothetical protein ACE5HZ_03845 [Fidelibacterota bacterium]
MATNRIYKNLGLAFLYQAMVSLISLSLILYVSPAGILALAGVGLRPLIMKKRDVEPEHWPWHIFYWVGKMALIITGISLVVMFLFFQLWDVEAIFPGLRKSGPLFALPFFLFIHGLLGTALRDTLTGRMGKR